MGFDQYCNRVIIGYRPNVFCPQQDEVGVVWYSLRRLLQQVVHMVPGSTPNRPSTQKTNPKRIDSYRAV